MAKKKPSGGGKKIDTSFNFGANVKAKKPRKSQGIRTHKGVQYGS